MAEKESGADLEPHGKAVHQRLNLYGALYLETKNPVFVWLALSALHAPRSRARLSGQAMPFLTIPLWAESYLLKLGWDLARLAEGTLVHITETAQETATHTSHVSTQDALTKLSYILGFSKAGVNQLRQYQTLHRDYQTVLKIEALQKTGMKATKALEEVVGQFPEQEETVIRKRVTSGRKLLRNLRFRQALPQREH